MISGETPLLLMSDELSKILWLRELWSSAIEHSAVAFISVMCYHGRVLRSGERQPIRLLWCCFLGGEQATTRVVLGLSVYLIYFSALVW